MKYKIKLIPKTKRNLSIDNFNASRQEKKILGERNGSKVKYFLIADERIEKQKCSFKN